MNCKVFIVFFMLTPFSTFAQIPNWNQSPKSLNTYLDLLGQLNYFSPTEGAGSRGTYGLGIAAGLQKTPIPRLLKRSMDHSSQLERGIIFPRFSLIKGLSVPVNLGISFSRVDSRSHQWVGFIQWTLFEELLWPSLAIRYINSKLTGMHEADIVSQSLEAVLSYGFLRYFNIFYSLNIINHNINFRTNREIRRKSHFMYGYGGGIEVTIIPPFTKVSFEVQKSLDNRNYYSMITYLL